MTGRVDQRGPAAWPSPAGAGEPAVPANTHSGASAPLIRIDRVRKNFRTPTGILRALDTLSLDIREGEFVTLIGRSGCGKTTLLDIIGGLTRPSAGTVTLGGQRVDHPSRDVGFVFQRAVMLRWRNLLDNMLLPIELFGLRKADYLARCRELLAVMGLETFERAYPHQLSGGMQQRAAIARSLLYDPRVLLMDEPFGALDAFTREQLNLELLKMWEQSHKTIVFVTHDISEAVFLSDRVVLLTSRPGRIREVLDIYLPRPRGLETTYLPEFAAYRRQIRAHLD